MNNCAPVLTKQYIYRADTSIPAWEAIALTSVVSPSISPVDINMVEIAIRTERIEMAYRKLCSFTLLLAETKAEVYSASGDDSVLRRGSGLLFGATKAVSVA